MDNFLAFAFVFCVWGAASYRLFEKEFGRKRPSGRTFRQERLVEFLMWPWLVAGLVIVLIARTIHAFKTLREFLKISR